MRCPQCAAETPDDQWNCVSCRVNLYWAHQHYEELARIRRQQGLETRPKTPEFLTSSHQNEMDERASRGLQRENRVRLLARKVMRKPPSG